MASATTTPSLPRRPGGIQAVHHGVPAAFSDATSTTEIVVAEGDRVAVRYTMRDSAIISPSHDGSAVIASRT
jgi:hypothetical protein